MVTNDPKVIAKLLRAVAGGTHAQASQHDVIFNAAADMLDPPGDNDHNCECSLCAERLTALREIIDTPCSMVNDSESLRHTIKTLQQIARKTRVYD